MFDPNSVTGMAEVENLSLEDDGSIPNNSACPLLIYRRAISLPEQDSASVIESVFTANNWPAAWRYGIFPFHHYHSTAHEVLGVYNGTATVLFGGESGIAVQVSPGDVVIIPAGVGHKLLEASAGFSVVGAYPAGTTADLCRGHRDERVAAIASIAGVVVPDQDPVYGTEGPLKEHWLRHPASTPGK